MATVRIKDDVNTVLKAKAATDPEQRSVTQLVDHWLRLGLGMIEPTPAEAETTPAPAARAPKAGPARMSKPRARRAATSGQGGAKCTHPIGRRVMGNCLACGASVG